MRRVALAFLVLVVSPALAEPPKDAPAAQPRVVIFPDGGTCRNAAAEREAQSEHLTCVKERGDCEKTEAAPIFAAAGVGAALAALLTVFILHESGHLK